ncbi:MAG: F0F1 ATP synthase subunit A [Candidatus Marinimicrobia bacterium]|nr:F0F1 ATP synthase subunit A [Candidatus Neomarinimicrobiota bacterium]MBL7022537.1 F0F1 ATP synthase subunit A [Candidatus Neomarinimicrobiota bacterium]MBL7108893.1 F0F1 ATP synthase subunit A [Candidatus Neomarinimicrobiota bacterium]
MQKLLKYFIGLLIAGTIIFAGGHGQDLHSTEAEHNNHQVDEHSEKHSDEGVTGSVIMDHMLDDRVFEIFNPFNIQHPIQIELYPKGGKAFWGINKQVVMMWLNTLLIILLLTVGYKKNKKVQSGIGNFLEVLVVFIRDEVVYINMGEKQGRRFLPLILTFFFFILTMNLMGLIPGTTTPTANINVTAALAIITLLTYLIFGNKDFWRHIFATPGVPLWLLPIMIPVELLGLLTKPFALAVRLFANMNAGHIIILAFLGIIINLQNYWVALGSVPMAIAINMLEIFVAFLQAYVFSLLSTIFISMAVVEHKEH